VVVLNASVVFFFVVAVVMVVVSVLTFAVLFPDHV